MTDDDTVELAHGIAQEEANLWLSRIQNQLTDPMPSDVIEAYRNAFVVGFFTAYKLQLKGELE